MTQFDLNNLLLLTTDIQSLKSQPTGEILFWVGMLMLAMLVLGTLVMMIRKKLLSGASGETHDIGSLMEHLRTQHRQGLLSDGEYQAVISDLRDKMIASSPQSSGSKTLAAPPIAAPDTNSSVLRHKPGFDLTGDPLPTPPTPPPPPPSNSKPPSDSP